MGFSVKIFAAIYFMLLYQIGKYRFCVAGFYEAHMYSKKISGINKDIFYAS